MISDDELHREEISLVNKARLITSRFISICKFLEELFEPCFSNEKEKLCGRLSFRVCYQSTITV